MEYFIEQIFNAFALQVSAHFIYKLTTKLKLLFVNFGKCDLFVDQNVIYRSENYLILNKNYDVLINSNEPCVKV